MASSDNVYVVMSYATSYDEDNAVLGVFATHEAADRALEAWWDYHDPRYFGDREKFNEGHGVEQWPILTSGEGWRPEYDDGGWPREAVSDGE